MSAKNSPQETPQAQASDPRNSAWVSANAGSGKTTVLVQRVIRLLLDGVPPGRILCLTYTKAAAAHMANKVLEKLSTWVRLDDEKLDAEIAKVEPGKPSPQRRARARRLFSAALETPGGLKVQTIHAFCDRVLHMFPVEAQTPAGFDVLDDLGERDLIENARLQVLLDAGRYPSSQLGQALAHCIEIVGDDTIEKVIGEAVRARRNLHGFNRDHAEAAMRASLGLHIDDTVTTITQRMLEGGAMPRREWEGAAHALQELGSKNATKIGDALLAAVHAPEAEIVETYLAVFLNAAGEPKADKTFGAAADLARVERIRDWLFSERIRLADLLNTLHAVRERDRSVALLTIASAVVTRYQEAKARRGVLDFADLVTKTVGLLEREESAWVHFKLDGGIDHILVDEAQDTSPEQWRIIAKLAEEFFAGKGASDRPRTIFAVGDEKQSIFSFQGADPKRFDEMRRDFSKQIAASGEKLSMPRLLNSYRSVDVVLKAVDKVFLPPEARSGLTASDDAEPVHVAVRQKAPGMVEIWPPIKAEKSSDEDDGWDKPHDRMREQTSQMQLARRIATAVKQWIGGGLTVGDRENADKPRAVRAGDIIVLVQSRGPLFDAILRALKQGRVPVAGADRLTLTENIAVMDMLALGDALLLAEDDLSLACVLKSPLFGFTDEDLFALCFERSGTLAQSLTSATKEEYTDAAKTLSRWRENALHLRPFDFYSRVLGRDGGRKKMIARLGLEAADALDEFLAAALSYESAETPSLHGFLSFLRRAEAEVKRDLEAGGTSVRVMTVHGVKGLEAPVVVLADTTSLPSPAKDPRVVRMQVEGTAEEAAPLIWAGRKEENSQAVTDARDRARDLREQEYRRLLYVALTRAADVLVVCGALKKRQDEAEEGSWYDLVDKALAKDAAHSVKHKVSYSDEEVIRWRTPAFPPLAMEQEAKEEAEVESPTWLAAKWTEREASRTRLPPSHPPRDLVREAVAKKEGGKARGILLHRLLQSLPELSPDAREAAALRYLAQAAPDLAQAEKDKLAQEALAVIANPDCAEIFAPGSRAEPELIARIADGAREIEIPARLDRIKVDERLVTFADFKSDAFVPASLAEIPEHYIAQLSAYRAALAEAFPGRASRALLIFTAAPRVFEIPQESLDSAWQRRKTQTSLAFA
jgi:ATP-dependent helicase/nuclease subunit A